MPAENALTPSSSGAADPARERLPLLLYQVLVEELERQDPEAAKKLPQELREPPPLEVWRGDDDEERRRFDGEKVKAFYAWLHQNKKRSAICFSGGGIRSATYGLGILQGLARTGLLRELDYLSTVSGGGYLGSWLTAWIHREATRRKQPALDPVAAVETDLASGSDNPLCPERTQIRHLRSYSRYMSPRLGILSADTWTLGGLFLRNLLLNWTVLLPLLALALMIPWATIWLMQHPPLADGRLLGVPARWLPFWAAALSGAIAIAYIIANRPSLIPARRREPRRRSQGWFVVLCLLPLLVMAFGLAVFWGWARLEHADVQLTVLGRNVSTLWAFAAFGALLHLAAFAISRAFVRGQGVRGVFEAVVAALSGALGGALTYAAARYFPTVSGDDISPLYASFAAPLVLGLFLLAATIFVGLGSRVMNDADREWVGRAGSWMLIAIVVGGALSALLVYGPTVLTRVPAWLSPLGGLSGVITLWLGRSAKTAGNKEGAEKGRGGKASGLTNLALGLAAPVFVVFILMLLAFGLTALVYALTVWRNPAYNWGVERLFFTKDQGLVALVLHAPWGALLLTAGLLALVGGVMGACIDVNRFSLHAAYRDRLIRAYLGASRSRRDPDPFTGFDEGDNVLMRDIAHGRPFHVLNIALNLVAGRNLAWQDRKAEPFTVSPLHCGSWPLGYRSSRDYGLHGSWLKPRHRRGRSEPRPAISLGTALAISGAAASPNMGYHSSPVITFLLALFNVRLGWWLGNPGRPGKYSYDQPGPRFAPRALFGELLGRTNDDHPYVYLSDGGHFDNLGLYEMVLRRCRYIVAIDAEGDPDFQFGGLANAIAKVRTDLGVPIEFAPLPMRRFDPQVPQDGPPPPYCALGRICYSCVDGNDPQDDGALLYIKASLNGSEPVDVVNYAKAHPAFPHESTGDQLYSESQFESYRALGSHVAGEVLKDFAVEGETGPLEAAFAYVEKSFGAAAGCRT